MEKQNQNSDKKFWIILASVIAILLCLRIFVLDWIWVSGESMLPTLSDGELVLAEKISKNTNGLQRGDIVIVTYPNGLQCVKRIIGMEGDTVAVENNSVILNGRVLTEPYLLEEAIQDMAAVTVPEETVFVMGDNRNHSSDSREPLIGPIPEHNIVGHAISVIYPLDCIRSIG